MTCCARFLALFAFFVLTEATQVARGAGSHFLSDNNFVNSAAKTKLNFLHEPILYDAPVRKVKSAPGTPSRRPYPLVLRSSTFADTLRPLTPVSPNPEKLPPSEKRTAPALKRSHTLPSKQMQPHLNKIYELDEEPVITQTEDVIDKKTETGESNKFHNTESEPELAMAKTENVIDKKPIMEDTVLSTSTENHGISDAVHQHVQRRQTSSSAFKKIAKKDRALLASFTKTLFGVLVVRLLIQTLMTAVHQMVCTIETERFPSFTEPFYYCSVSPIYGRSFCILFPLLATY